MEVFIRILIFIAFGLVLVAANFWFVRLAYRQYFTSEYVITPFNVIDPSGRSADNTGEALAQMMAARLRNIQAQLQSARLHSGASASSAIPFEDVRATALFVTKPVEIPTNLFEPVEIVATVGGVEVGGIISFLQNRLVALRTVQFTTYERAEGAVVAVDLSQFAPGRGYLWFESDKHPDEIATNSAFALLHAKLSEGAKSRIGDMALTDFRLLLETVIELDSVNRRARRGVVVTEELNKLLARIETQLENSPDWPELVFLAGSSAEGAGNIGKAVLHYRKLQALPVDVRAELGTDLVALAEERLRKLGASAAAITVEQEERFVAASREFARQMNLTGADPEIAFVVHENPGILAIWNGDRKRYEVNPPQIEAAGLPQYVALMGRFFLKHFDRCTSGNQLLDPRFWNQFRYSVVQYLIRSNPKFGEAVPFFENNLIFRALKALEAEVGVEPVQRLSLALLEQFECDWSIEKLGDRMVETVAARGLMAESAVRKALVIAGLPGGDED